MLRAWDSLTSEEFGALDPGRTIAILPVAAVEQHGRHLPVGTDRIICQGILDTLALPDGFDRTVLVLPMQAVGKSDEHLAYPGTLTLPSTLLIEAWTALGLSVARTGVRRLVLFNSHGGNQQVMEIVARELRVRARMLAVACGWMALGLPEGAVDPEEARFGIHGGSIETAMLLHLRPDLVVRERMAAFRSSAEDMADDFALLQPVGQPGFGWMAQDLNPEGVVGDASAATPELGRRLIEHAAGRLVALLQDMARFDLERLADGPLLHA